MLHRSAFLLFLRRVRRKRFSLCLNTGKKGYRENRQGMAGHHSNYYRPMRKVMLSGLGQYLKREKGLKRFL